ncbi:MAG: 23S rRNA (uracil(1939)-C(5))-methyltransferase RlmD [Bacillota bacterium]|nr:23S rRNA (uracil(1939)-C(5))-methyltransferase RlmD [Bacillota bacterium]
MPETAGRRSNVVSIEITGLNHDGDGVGRLDGLAVFVPGALPGDKVRARLTVSKKTYARAEVVEITKLSPGRIRPPCAVAEPCGGCSLQSMAYEEQLLWKTRAVEDAMARIGGLKEITVRPCLAAKHPMHYRNKVQFPVAMQRGIPVAGCYARGTHEVVPTEDCLIQHQTNNLIVRESLRLISELDLTVYDERRGGGLVRHIMGRVAPGTGEAMAVIVTSIKRFTRGGEFVSALMKAVPGLVGVLQNINSEKTNIILGRETRVITGRGHIDDLFGNDRTGRLRFRISPLSFYQVNAEQAAELYAQALEYAGLTRTTTAVDIYSGIGTITLFLARSCRQAFGIEEVTRAVADAKQNARLNGIENVRFLTGRAERVLPRFLQGRGVKPDVVVLDPPRKGCEEGVLGTVVKMRPGRIVYVSCYPATLARDLAILQRSGYRAVETQPVDMFPQTNHVESCTLVVRE